MMGQGISLIGTWMHSTAQGWLVYTLSGSALHLGGVAAAAALPGVLLTFLGGTLADRCSRRSLLMWVQALAGALALVLAALVYTHTVEVWHVMLLALAGGCVNAVEMPTRQSFFHELVGRDDLGSALALNSSVFNLTRALGPALAGVVVEYWGPLGCFLLNALSFLAPWFGLWCMRDLPAAQVVAHEGVWKAMAEGLRFVRSDGMVLRLLLWMTLTSLLLWGYNVAVPVYAREVLHGGAHHYGLLTSAVGLGAVFGALQIAVLKDGLHAATLMRRMRWGLMVFCTCLVGVALTRQFALALVLLAVAGWGMIAYFTSSNTCLQTGVPDSLRGRVMGVYHTVFNTCMPLGGLLCGALIQGFGVRVAMGGSAMVCFMLVALLWKEAEPASSGVSARSVT